MEFKLVNINDTKEKDEFMEFVKLKYGFQYYYPYHYELLKVPNHIYFIHLNGVNIGTFELNDDNIIVFLQFKEHHDTIANYDDVIQKLNTTFTCGKINKDTEIDWDKLKKCNNVLIYI